ncbi:MAG: hypothetical protein IT559_06965 [Alphaproteobacteria bacterium]|nr:hypothetical protein [Alphaproteobacteria bacterium]
MGLNNLFGKKSAEEQSPVAVAVKKLADSLHILTDEGYHGAAELSLTNFVIAIEETEVGAYKVELERAGLVKTDADFDALRDAAPRNTQPQPRPAIIYQPEDPALTNSI